jgi:predicted HAD superfamily phosphohydrolase YqeG
MSFAPLRSGLIGIALNGGRSRMVVYIDVDDTLVRSVGTKRVPMPAVIARVRDLHAAGHSLYLWSSGGAQYARATAEELGIAQCFAAFLPKPTHILDDQNISEWRDLIHVHPNEEFPK